MCPPGVRLLPRCPLRASVVPAGGRRAEGAERVGRALTPGSGHTPAPRGPRASSEAAPGGLRGYHAGTGLRPPEAGSILKGRAFSVQTKVVLLDLGPWSGCASFAPRSEEAAGIFVRGQSPGPGPVIQLWDLLAEGEAPARHLPPPSPRGTQGIQVCEALGQLGTVRAGRPRDKTQRGPVCESEVEVPWQVP